MVFFDKNLATETLLINGFHSPFITSTGFTLAAFSIL